MTREQVISALLYALVPLASVFLGAWLKGWAALPAGRALEEVRAELARLTHASGLYVQRQHDIFSEVYQLLRRAHDNLALVAEERQTLRHDVKDFTREELEAELKTLWRAPALREVLAKWDEGEQGRVDALRLLQAKLPLAHWDAATGEVTEGTNRYLTNALYFSDDGVAAAVNALLSALRHYRSAVAYGRQQVPEQELAERRKAMDEALNRVYTVFRAELREPGRLKSEGSALVSPAAEVFP